MGALKEVSTVADHAAVLSRGETAWSCAMNELTDEIKDSHLGV
jgi:ABC-type branched-subunit amino acid transport system ATPase component